MYVCMYVVACWFALLMELNLVSEDTMNGCSLLEKVVNMTNVHKHNNVTVSIKVQHGVAPKYKSFDEEVVSVESAFQ